MEVILSLEIIMAVTVLFFGYVHGVDRRDGSKCAMYA